MKLNRKTLNVKKWIGIVLIGSLAAGCSNTGPKQTAGTFIGGATGALVGSQFGKGTGQLFGVAIGTLAGAYLGGSIGAQMDAKDRELANRSMQHTLERLPDHQVSAWKNPNNQHRGQFKVTKTQEKPADHLVCREYEHEVFIGANKETVVGKACRDVRDPKAQWRVVKG